MEIKDKITSGAIGILAIAAIIMGANLLGQENVYVCEERQLAMICDSLSKINAEGIQTRCYFNDTYKICNEGWIKFEGEQSTSNFTDFTCNDETFIRECVNQEGKIILRIKNE